MEVQSPLRGVERREEEERLREEEARLGELEGQVKEINSPLLEFLLRAKCRLRGVERKVDESIGHTAAKVNSNLLLQLAPTHSTLL